MKQNWKKNMNFGENVKIAAAGALKRRSGLFRDNLRNSPERKVQRREGLKRCGARMWKIIVGDPRQNRHGGRNLSASAAEGISEILGTRDKTVATGGACPPQHNI